MAAPEVDDRDWSQLTKGERICQIEVEGYLVLHLENKSPNMAREAPGMNPSRWSRS